ncbi:DAAM2 [Symbiodinium natans]|uniref:DAAM2 protein n=1 Tax=Symbiodinium natans TaxID=878477 RepID=A0A812M898_9DINO|nr:DAAM2 [Symbiodinium natans]
MEARSSQELRKVLAIILRVGNYVNHGSGGTGACAFSIETLATTRSFKVGNMSMLQFLCVTLRRANPNFVDELSQSLRHVPAAAREKSVDLQSSIHAFLHEVEFAQKEVSAQPASEGAATLLTNLSSETADIQDASGKAFRACKDLLQFFCTAEEPYECFFLHLSDFVASFRKAWKDGLAAS